MDYSIVYSSKTGNTAELAKVIETALPKEVCKYIGQGQGEIATERVFLGFWTDKGSCDQLTHELLESAQNRQIFLFGTAGFGGSAEYYEQILSRIKELIPTSNKVIGTFMCQGKMPISVRQRYEQLLSQDSENSRVKDMLKNFDQAASHPNQEDFDSLKKQVLEI